MKISENLSHLTIARYTNTVKENARWLEKKEEKTTKFQGMTWEYSYGYSTNTRTYKDTKCFSLILNCYFDRIVWWPCELMSCHQCLFKLVRWRADQWGPLQLAQIRFGKTGGKSRPRHTRCIRKSSKTAILFINTLINKVMHIFLCRRWRTNCIRTEIKTDYWWLMHFHRMFIGITQKHKQNTIHLCICCMWVLTFHKEKE